MNDIMQEIYVKAFHDELEKLAKDTDVGFLQGTKAVTSSALDQPGSYLKHIYGGQGAGTAAGAAGGAAGGALAAKVLKKSGKIGAGVGAILGGATGMGIGAEVGLRKFLNKQGIKRSGVLWPKYRASEEAMKKYNLKPAKK